MRAKIFGIVLILLQSVVLAGGPADEVEYYAVFMGGAKVGYATHSRIVAQGKVTTTETMAVTMNRMGTPVSISTKETSIETSKGEPAAFVAEQDIGMGTMKTEGTIGTDGSVRVRTTGTGQAQEVNFVWPKDAVMSEGLRLLALQKGLKEGTSYNAKIFSPGAMMAIDSNVRVGAKQEVDLLGRVVVLTKVETTMSMPGMGQITTEGFVDDDFRAFKSVIPMAGIKLELVACEKEFALGSNDVYEIAEKMFLASPQPIKNVRSAKSISYHLKPVSGAGGLTIPAGDNQHVQKLEDGSVIVVVEPVSAPADGTFPYNGTDKELLDAIRPGRFVQSDDANIIALAKRAVGNTKDAAEAAKKIERFVADYVKDMNLSVGYASASEVAASRKGDCTEFAVLSAAICRSIGIPARVVVGVVYVDNFSDKPGFAGHAWVEAYIGGKWVGLDATFKASGRGGFDAGHIAIAAGNGEPADFFNIATTLGRFRIEKILVNSGK